MDTPLLLFPSATIAAADEGITPGGDAKKHTQKLPPDYPKFTAAMPGKMQPKSDQITLVTPFNRKGNSEA
jgi:hypothetical protein